MLEHYYHSNMPHNYMNIDNYDLVIFDYLKNLGLNNSNVMEIGSGFGRYTKALSMVSERVFAVEPNSFMYDRLALNFNNTKNVTTIASSMEELLNQPFDNHIDRIFMFHVLHHLAEESYGLLRKLIEKLNAPLFIIEPNHLNPMFFFQIFVTKDMTFKEEKRMLLDNSSLLVKKHFQPGFAINRTYIGFLPPVGTKLLSKMSPFFTNSNFLSTKYKNPFSAYSVLELKHIK